MASTRLRWFFLSTTRSSVPAVACVVAAGHADGTQKKHNYRTLCESRSESRSHPKFNRDWDLRHPKDDSIALQGPSRVMLLIRHGQYENKGGPSYGLLTDLGREQAKMAGQHIVARMQMDPEFKKSMFKITSSDLQRAVETADIIEKEILSELAWVDIPMTSFPENAKLEFIRHLHDAYYEFTVVELVESVQIKDSGNFLQSAVEVCNGSTVRALLEESSEPKVRNAGMDFADLAKISKQISVYQPLSSQELLDARFSEWQCSECEQEKPASNIHWSDKAEKNGIGFCSDCFRKGVAEKLLEHRAKGDTFTRVTKGAPCSPFRMPNDKNLNEADVDTCSILMPDESLYDHYGELNSQILRDHAQVEAAFYTHMSRSVDHKKISRANRSDTVATMFILPDGRTKSVHLTASEFGKLELDADLRCTWVYDEETNKRVDGDFCLQTIGNESVVGMSVESARKLVSEKTKQSQRIAPAKRIEIIVAHQNIIRYFFLRSMQFDTTAWLNFNGSNCTMTQLRITRRGDVICDFFGDHGSKMPVSAYTFNKRSDY